MPLQTSDEITVSADRESAFAVLSDPYRLARCIPGCSDLAEIGPDRYSALLTNKVSFMTLSFKVIIQVTKKEPPNTIEATVTGDASGLAGRVSATAAVVLTDAPGGGTTIRYATDVNLTGKLGGLGQPVFRTTSARIAREFGANLKAEFEGAPAERSS